MVRNDRVRYDLLRNNWVKNDRVRRDYITINRVTIDRSRNDRVRKFRKLEMIGSQIIPVYRGLLKLGKPYFLSVFIYKRRMLYCCFFE